MHPFKQGLPDEERPRLHERFLEVLQAKAPDVLARARARPAAATASSAKRKREGDSEAEEGSAKEGGLLASWHTIGGTGANGDGGGGFSFGFAL